MNLKRRKVNNMELFVVIWFVLFFYIVGKGIAQWVENNNSPILTVPATIMDMRRKTHHHHSGGRHHHSHSYHILFQLDSGERLELRVKRHEYRELAVGDQGKLTYQGTRYLGFERT